MTRLLRWADRIITGLVRVRATGMGWQWPDDRGQS